ncbi:hypothetical protein ABTD85_23575, partial [Acinetobacter baumannii]
DWAARLDRFFGTLTRGDVLVVTTLEALGVSRADASRAVAELRQRGVIVQGLAHGDRHLHTATVTPPA